MNTGSACEYEFTVPLSASAAFIKELMRRAIQFHLEHSDSTAIELRDVQDALDEMLFRGGSLNRKLLGGNIQSGEVAER